MGAFPGGFHSRWCTGFHPHPSPLSQRRGRIKRPCRLGNNFLIPANLERITEGVAKASKPYLENQRSELAPINDRKKVVRSRITNINDSLAASGPAANNFRTLIKDLDTLETELQELEKKSAQIAEATEGARLFLKNKEGIIATALDRKTFANPDNVDKVRDFMHIFIRRVDAFAREGITQRVTIDYELPVRLATSDDDPTIETIYLEKSGSRFDK